LPFCAARLSLPARSISAAAAAAAAADDDDDDSIPTFVYRANRQHTRTVANVTVTNR